MTVSHVLLLAFLCSNANGQIPAKPDLTKIIENFDKFDVGTIEKIKLELDKDVSRLAKEGEKLRQDTKNLRVTCPKVIQELNKKFLIMMEKASENQKILYKLLIRMQEEEAEHIKLEAEMKRVSEVLEVLELQHLLLEQDLQLAHTRRTNGTAKHCAEVTKELASYANEELKTRSAEFNVYKTRTRRFSGAARNRMYLKNKIQMIIIFKRKLQKARDEILSEYQLESETCNIKKENINALIRTTAHALETSERSIQLLTGDLKVAIDFSEALRLEIKTGIEFINELGGKVQKFKENFLQFQPDYVCYKRIQNTD